MTRHRLQESFRFAFAGIGWLLRTQRNTWIQTVATLFTFALGLWLGIERWEWCALLVVISLAWTSEALNTAIELVCDAVCPEHHELVGRAKDVAAGGVLIAAIVALLVGLIVFLPYLLPRTVL